MYSVICTFLYHDKPLTKVPLTGATLSVHSHENVISLNFLNENCVSCITVLENFDLVHWSGTAGFIISILFDQSKYKFRIRDTRMSPLVSFMNRQHWQLLRKNAPVVNDCGIPSTRNMYSTYRYGRQLIFIVSSVAIFHTLSVRTCPVLIIYSFATL